MEMTADGQHGLGRVCGCIREDEVSGTRVHSAVVTIVPPPPSCPRWPMPSGKGTRNFLDPTGTSGRRGVDGLFGPQTNALPTSQLHGKAEGSRRVVTAATSAAGGEILPTIVSPWTTIGHHRMKHDNFNSRVGQSTSVSPVYNDSRRSQPSARSIAVFLNVPAHDENVGEDLWASRGLEHVLDGHSVRQERLLRFCTDAIAS